MVEVQTVYVPEAVLVKGEPMTATLRRASGAQSPVVLKIEEAGGFEDTCFGKIVTFIEREVLSGKLREYVKNYPPDAPPTE